VRREDREATQYAVSSISLLAHPALAQNIKILVTLSEKLYRKGSLSLYLNLDTETYFEVLSLFLSRLFVVSTASAIMMMLVLQLFITAFIFSCNDHGRLLVPLFLPKQYSGSKQEYGDVFSPTPVNITYCDHRSKTT
jgi:hypothetical protein